MCLKGVLLFVLSSIFVTYSNGADLIKAQEPLAKDVLTGKGRYVILFSGGVSQRSPQEIRQLTDRIIIDLKLPSKDVKYRYEKVASGFSAYLSQKQVAALLREPLVDQVVEVESVYLLGECPSGQISDCNGNCAPSNWIGDGYCDDGAYAYQGVDIYFNCSERDCDGGDCSCGPSSCPGGEINDCIGNCAPSNWLGDGYCDEGADDIYLNCPELDCDEGDCTSYSCGGPPTGVCCLPPAYPTESCLELVNYETCENIGGRLLLDGESCNLCREDFMPYNWGLDRIDQSVLPLDRDIYNSTQISSSNGEGVIVYVIDDGIGIAPDHIEFEDRILPGKSFTNLYNQPLEDGSYQCESIKSHGAHVAGSAVGKTIGVAPGASLVSLKVFPCSGTTGSDTIIAAVEWIANNHGSGVYVGDAVVNMSLGGPYSAFENNAIEEFISLTSIPVCVAAGNENQNACNTSPASAPGVITVGSSTIGDERSSFSNWGECVDIFGPGSSIWSTAANSVFENGSQIDFPNLYYNSDGTSMACPHVAGVVALYLSANSGATSQDVSNALLKSGIEGVLSNVNGSPNLLLQLIPTELVSCPGDITGDGVVDVLDLLEVIGNFGASGDTGDANSDGEVDVLDLLEVIGNFGNTTC